MRSDVISGRDEQRDSIDIKFVELLALCGVVPILINNNLDVCKRILQLIPINSIILSGGGDIAHISREFTPRDSVEYFLIDWAVSRKLPILGVCRGMQCLTIKYGGELEKVERHVGIRHQLKETAEVVNSFHNYAVSKMPEAFEAIHYAVDGVLESFQCKKNRILGMMWHPERENYFRDVDIQLISKHLKGESE